MFAGILTFSSTALFILPCYTSNDAFHIQPISSHDFLYSHGKIGCPVRFSTSNFQQGNYFNFNISEECVFEDSTCEHIMNPVYGLFNLSSNIICMFYEDSSTKCFGSDTECKIDSLDTYACPSTTSSSIWDVEMILLIGKQHQIFNKI